VPCCRKYTLIDCFFGDFAHRVGLLLYVLIIPKLDRIYYVVDLIKEKLPQCLCEPNLIFRSTDFMRLERENKHLMSLIENLRTSTPDTRSLHLEDENRALSDNIFEYKSMISKLTKVGVMILAVIIVVVVVVVLVSQS